MVERVALLADCSCHSDRWTQFDESGVWPGHAPMVFWSLHDPSPIDNLIAGEHCMASKSAHTIILSYSKVNSIIWAKWSTLCLVDKVGLANGENNEPVITAMSIYLRGGRWGQNNLSLQQSTLSVLANLVVGQFSDSLLWIVVGHGTLGYLEMPSRLQDNASQSVVQAEPTI